VANLEAPSPWAPQCSTTQEISSDEENTMTPSDLIQKVSDLMSNVDAARERLLPEGPTDQQPDYPPRYFGDACMSFEDALMLRISELLGEFDKKLQDLATQESRDLAKTQDIETIEAIQTTLTDISNFLDAMNDFIASVGPIR
jgi:hypothetical protein